MDFYVFGRRVQHFRKKKGMTLAQCALFCGIQKDHLSKIECGFATPKPGTLLKICNTLNVSADILLQNLTKEYYIFAIESYMAELDKTVAVLTLKNLESLMKSPIKRKS